MDKVFCGNCTHYWDSDMTSNVFCAENPKREVTWLGIRLVNNPAEKNANNDCKDYRPLLSIRIMEWWRRLWTRLRRR